MAELNAKQEYARQQAEAERERAEAQRERAEAERAEAAAKKTFVAGTSSVSIGRSVASGSTVGVQRNPCAPFTCEAAARAVDVAAGVDAFGEGVAILIDSLDGPQPGLLLGMVYAGKASRGVATTVRGGVTAATQAGRQVGRFRLTETVARHADDIVTKGPFKGQPARPYLNSPNTIEQIMQGGRGIPDPGGVPGALRWDVPGTFRGTQGAWELVVGKANEILHFNFVR